MRLRTVLLSLSLLAVADLAHASSDGAWAALRAKSDKACVRAASDLRDRRVMAYGDAFQDVTVSTLEGRLRARAARPARDHDLCLRQALGPGPGLGIAGSLIWRKARPAVDPPDWPHVIGQTF